MGMADFNARQRAQKKADQQRKNESKSMMNSYQGSGLSGIDTKMYQIKKEQKNQERAAIQSRSAHAGWSGSSERYS